MKEDGLRKQALELLGQLELDVLTLRDHPEDLSSAVYGGQVDWAFEFLVRGAQPMAHDVKSAAGLRDHVMMKLLLECGAPPRMGASRGHSDECIVVAAGEGGLLCLDVLIAAGVPTSGDDAWSAAEAAALAGDFACFERLHDGWSQGPGAATRRAELTMWAKSGDHRGLSAYLESGGPPPVTLPAAPPLRRRHDTAIARDKAQERADKETKLVDWIEKGAFGDPFAALSESSPFHGCSAVEFAARHGLSRAGVALLQQADESDAIAEQKTLDALLFQAAGSGATAMALRLLEQGANATAVDDRDVDVLCAAAERGDATLVEALLDAGADLDHASAAGGYAYQAAAGFDKQRIELAFRRAAARQNRRRRPGVEVVRRRPRLKAPRGAMRFFDQLATGHPEAAIGAIEAPVEQVSASLMASGGIERVEHAEKVGVGASFDCCFVVGFKHVP